MNSHTGVAPTGRTIDIRQRVIYDERYRGEGYDNRSAVRVLTAEREALRQAAERAGGANPAAGLISLVDFGYGTGRVTNEFIADHLAGGTGTDRPLRVVAYDISSVGLRKAAASLMEMSFEPAGSGLAWRPDEAHGYVAGTLAHAKGGVSVVFVHGSEYDEPAAVGRLLLGANGGEQSLITTSWYSGLGHVTGAKHRDELFHELGALTHENGEIIVAVAALGDVVELQSEWERRLRADDTDGFPVEVVGDVVYETELGQLNFWHVFGEDLNRHLQQITGTGQHWWVEAVRYPDEEFSSSAEEQQNYARVVAKNREMAGAVWSTDDFRELHTVAGFRSGSARSTW